MVATTDDIAPTLGPAKPGRYIVEEVCSAGRPLPSGHSCRCWGTAIRQADGQVVLEPDPWPA